MMMNTVAILFTIIVIPIAMVLHYVTRWKESKTLTSEDEKILADMWDSAEKIENRLQNIEHILDITSPTTSPSPQNQNRKEK